MRFSFKTFLIWVVAALFYFYEYFIQVIPNVLARPLINSLHINTYLLGYLGSAYFIAYVLMQIPVGIMLDRFGPRRCLLLAVFFCVGGTFALALTKSYWLAVLARAFTGLGSAFAFIGVLKVAQNCFGRKQFVFWAAVSLALGTFGASVGSIVMRTLLLYWTWRSSVMILAMVGLILAFTMWLMLNDLDQDTQQLPRLSEISIELSLALKGLSRLLRKPINWFAASYIALCYAPISVLGTLWGYSFLLAKFHSRHSEEVALIVSMLFIGLTIGSIIMGAFFQRIKKNQRQFMVLFAVLAAISLSALIMLPMSKLIAGLCLLTYGVLISSFAPIYAMTANNNEHQLSATSMAFINMTSMLSGGVILEPLIGYWFKSSWLHSHINFAYSQQVMMILPMMTLIAQVFLCGVPNRLAHKKSVQEHDKSLVASQNPI